MTCDCSGTNLCSIQTCSGYKLINCDKISILKVRLSVSCQKSTEVLCGRCLSEFEVPLPSAQLVEYRQIQVGSPTPNNMFNIEPFEDTNDLNTKNYNTHGKWACAQRLCFRYITVRLMTAFTTGQNFLCGIFNTCGATLPDGPDMKVTTTIEGLNGQTVEWLACDDVGECSGSSGTSLLEQHSIAPRFSDGWCVKPLSLNGDTALVFFSNVVGMEGVVFQSPGGFERIFSFGGPSSSAVSGSVDPSGLSVDGSVDIKVNMNGIFVPFS